MSSTRTVTQEKAAAAAPLASKQSSPSSPPSVEVPLPFTLTSLREAIPKKCFDRNVWTSVYYMLRDFAFIAACYFVYPYINAAEGKYNPYGLTKFMWWNVTGFFGWCLFVVGHDCGEDTYTPPHRATRPPDDVGTRSTKF